jgi:hypothetical protein
VKKGTKGEFFFKWRGGLALQECSSYIAELIGVAGGSNRCCRGPNKFYWDDLDYILNYVYFKLKSNTFINFH